MKKIQKIMIISVFLLFIVIFSNNVYAGSQEWNSLDYNVTLNADGSADIVETWDVDISDTNTMFKDFKASSNDYYYFTDVKVTQIINGVEKPLTEIFEEQYHVDSGCYYGLMIDSDTFEIAWNVGLDSSSDTRTYKIYYTVENAVKVYLDCAEFYWQFLSNDNTMTGDNVTGTITIPSGITDIEKLHIWGHGDFSGNTERTSTNTLKFDMKHIYSNSMLEIRVVAEDNVFETANMYYEKKIDEILTEEAKWAEEANAKKALYKNIIIVIAIVVAIVFIIYLRKIIKYISAGKELKMQEYPKNELKYFRDIPNEKSATPAKASYFYYFGKTNSAFENYTSNIFSATLLGLTLKKYISLEPIDKNNVKINILNSNTAEPLERDEELIYNFLVKNSNSDTNSVDTKTLEKYAKRNYEAFYRLMKDVCKAAKNFEEMNGAIDYDRKKISEKWSGKGTLYLIGIFCGLFCMPIIFIVFPIFIEFIICAILCFKNSSKISVLSEKAYEELNEWKALKNYMTDFSLLKEKQVPDLILWEKYLVYATAFGISKKVLDQLVEIYPQMTSEDYYRSGHYTYLYIASSSGFDSLNNLERSFNNICRTANSAYSAAHSSSSGSGGGFSGGGGGRRRWRKLRWQIIRNNKYRYLLEIAVFLYYKKLF